MLTIDGRCFCKRCEGDGRPNIYRMVGSCHNCGTDNILILYREGDGKGDQKCPVCGNMRSVRSSTQRLATADEFPEALVKAG